MVSYALIVGINEYPDSSGFKTPLRGAVADACDFAGWALDKAGGGVDPARLFFWAHPWPAKPPQILADALAQAIPQWHNQIADWAEPDRTRAPYAGEIISTLERTGQKLRAAAFEGQQEASRVYVFFAGHGIRTTEVNANLMQTCFVAGDFRPAAGNSADGLVPCTSFRRSLRNNRFDEVLLFLDCCRNDFPITALRALPRCDLTNDRDAPQWSMGHATQDSGFSYETTDEPYRGAYSLTFIEGLRTSRDAQSGELTIERLDRYVRDNIGHATEKAQTPYFDFQPRDKPFVILAGQPAQAPQAGPVVDMSALTPGQQVLLTDGTNRPIPGIAPLIAEALPVPLPPLPDGLYALEPLGDPHRAILFKHPRDRHVSFT